MKTWGTHWEQVDMVRAREKKLFLNPSKHHNYGKKLLVMFAYMETCEREFSSWVNQHPCFGTMVKFPIFI
jgi:hypothetical protein